MTEKPYKSPYQAYPFLAEPGADLRCDFEIATDEFASEVGLLAALLRRRGGDDYQALAGELIEVETLVYHANPTLRTFFSVTDAELNWLNDRAAALYEQAGGKQESLFQLPAGSEEACRAHILRSKAKALTRLSYRAAESGLAVPAGLYDFLNMLSGYFYRLALRLNRLAGTGEIAYHSRNYKINNPQTKSS
ncbi:MAG: ATP--cob(I)alamin adenosyltransferase [Gracilibacteraceae bacterium]|jgi:cob(I)alamin adenosyltransferase|nr:ATP--cob(I)alamin adenosyltransferase [Gracilibacteraceae bacterium]